MEKVLLILIVSKLIFSDMDSQSKVESWQLAIMKMPKKIYDSWSRLCDGKIISRSDNVQVIIN